MLKFALGLVALTAVCLMCGVSGAALMTFQADVEFSGGSAPAGAAPWVTATFDDNNTAGSITLTLAATNLTGSEYISEWYLNFDPTLNVSSLVFDAPTIVGSLDVPTISKGPDSFKADGDGYYDIMLAFSTSGIGGGSHRFGAGESIIYTITGIPTLTSQAYRFKSVNGGGTGEYLMAVHVQSIGSDGSLSGWIGPEIAPEPATMSLLVLGGLAMLRRVTNRKI